MFCDVIVHTLYYRACVPQPKPAQKMLNKNGLTFPSTGTRGLVRSNPLKPTDKRVSIKYVLLSSKYSLVLRDTVLAYTVPKNQRTGVFIILTSILLTHAIGLSSMISFCAIKE